MDKALVAIPTVRNPQVVSDYAKNAIEHKYDIDKLYFMVLTENFVDKQLYQREMDRYSLNGVVLNAADRTKMMKDWKIDKYEFLLPRRTHAETSFALIHMMFNKEFKYGFFIDDDTSPEHMDFFGGHIANLNFSGKTTAIESDKNWGNVLYYTHALHHFYPRGYPYCKMGEKVKTSTIEIRQKGRVWLSHGLWTNVPDLDAIRILMDGNLEGQSNTRMKESNYGPNFIVKKGNCQTVCSMNLAFTREIIPAFYQMPMEDNPFKISRFDDIWSGVVAKKVVDELGAYIMNGAPLCRHDKAKRSTFIDVNFEAPGYESNEHISDVISGVHADDSDINGLTRKIADKLVLDGRTEMLRYCGLFLGRWAEMMERIS